MSLWRANPRAAPFIPTRWSSSATIRLNRKSSLPPPPYSVGMAMPEEAVLAGLLEGRPVDDPGLVPAGGVGDHVGLDEAPEAGPELVVLVVEQAAVAWLSSLLAGHPAACPADCGTDQACSESRSRAVDHYARQRGRPREPGVIRIIG